MARNSLPSNIEILSSPGGDYIIRRVCERYQMVNEEVYSYEPLLRRLHHEFATKFVTKRAKLKIGTTLGDIKFVMKTKNCELVKKNTLYFLAYSETAEL